MFVQGQGHYGDVGGAQPSLGQCSIEHVGAHGGLFHPHLAAAQVRQPGHPVAGHQRVGALGNVQDPDHLDGNAFLDERQGFVQRQPRHIEPAGAQPIHALGGGAQLHQAQGKAFVQAQVARQVQGLVPRPRVGAHRQRGLIAGAARAQQSGARGQGKCNASPPPPGTFAGGVSGVGHSGLHCPMVSECVRPRAYVLAKGGGTPRWQVSQVPTCHARQKSPRDPLQGNLG